jgi:galactose mutarotase-like enzyme
VIARHGAELQSWTVGGHDLVWSGDAPFWPRRAPLLFPIVGRCNGGMLHVDGRDFAIGGHGFTRDSDFTLVDRTDDQARFVLRDDAATQAQFPFAFRLTVTYRLSDDGLETTAVVGNPGDRPLPYAMGFHPAFRWPLAGSAAVHEIRFDRPEQAAVPTITSDGLFAPEMRPVPLTDGGTRLALHHDLFLGDALCFLNAASTGLTFANDQGQALRVTVQDLPHLALWAKDGAPFLCIEAWTGHGDPVGFSSDIREKPSMRQLAPGAEAAHVFACVFQA